MTPRFQLAGFPVQVHPLFFLTTLGLGLSWLKDPVRLAVWFGVVFASVLLHELGHALAYRRYGCPASITLHGLGGTTTGEGAQQLTHRQHLWVSLAGPFAGFLLGGLVLGLSELTPVGQAGGLAGFTVRSLLWVNIGLGLFNLLPIVPLDGGHAMAALVRMRAGYRYEWLIHLLSLGVALAGLGLSIVRGQLGLGLIMLVLAVMNAGQFWQAWMEWRELRQIRASTLSVLRRPEPSRAEAQTSVDRLLRELHLPSHASAPPASAPPAEARARATPPEPPEEPHDPLVVGKLLLDSELSDLAIRPLRAAFASEPSANTGHLLVTALLNTQRFLDLGRLLAGPGAVHLGGETLALIATRTEAAGQRGLATRARELHAARQSPPTGPARAPRA